MPDIALIQEPYLAHSHLPGIPPTSKTFQSTSQQAVIIYNGPLSPLLTSQTQHSVTIKLETTTGHLQITNVYFPPSEELDPLLIEISTVVRKGNNQILLAGDFNASSPLWGARVENVRGKMVLEYAMTNRLSIINTSDSPPTFRTIRAEGWPDLTMVSSQLANQMSEWHVMDIPSLSDHRIISYLIGAQLTYTLKQRFLNLLRPYVGQLIFNFQASNTVDGLDDAYRHLIGTLTSAAKQTYKKKTPSQKKELSWWNDKLTANRRSRVRALRRLAQSETDSIQRDQKMQTKSELKLSVDDKSVKPVTRSGRTVTPPDRLAYIKAL
ncbi:uncharacterized protein LOC118203418 [Stegodyphus dumicola]|uniref:uncharacterized protein LOC118203418 n=1 Tax=Stegodyphus dumicola TaxID=202533 RepID=UPI0015AC9D1D|nr:uncharacterized protein LOC118203418 [Stegodyphus dumicola]